MNKIFFVVLHYNNHEDTVKCVDSILELEYSEKVNVLVIDNNSPNQSGKKIVTKYSNNKNVEVVLLDENVGFSKANNIGYKKARDAGANTIICLNNDTVIKDREFLQKLNKTYGEVLTDILAPDVINLDGHHQNPLKKYPMSVQKAKKNLLVKKCILIMLAVPIVNKLVAALEMHRDRKWMEKYYKSNREDFSKDDLFVPFGACIIFTKNWIKKENIAFPSNTFMYMEEDFLGVYMMRKKYSIVYADELKVMHADGASVSNSHNKIVDKLRFKYKNQIAALKEYVRFLYA